MGEPRARQVWQLWPKTSRRIQRGAESVQVEWSHEEGVWTVQFSNLCLVLHSDGQLETPSKSANDLYQEDPSLIHRDCEGQVGKG